MFLGNTFLKNICASCMQVPFARVSNKVVPGIRRRLKIAEGTEETDLDDLDYEANFESFGHSHKQHRKELNELKEKLQCDIVKQKYFKAKYPNFLTWHDKEQIRQLHRKDPEEWNYMTLSEGFPALPEIIKKVIKSNWKIENVERMKKHDESVMENWRKLKNNEFEDLPDELVSHLKKFSNRKINHHTYDNVEDYSKIEYKPKLTCTEFSEIITSYEELTRKDESPTAIEGKISNTKGNVPDFKKKISQPNKMKDRIRMESSIEEDTFFTEPIKNKQPMTLGTLRNKLQNDLEKGGNVTSEDVQIIEMDRELVEKAPESESSVDQLDYTKYNTGKLMKIDEKKPKDYDHLVYPEKIKIPKKILKKGHTYKLNDCFYDSDGTFLYRVPGLL
ncbi:uncharacterized protein LOC123315030 [Coccinella septempunctata]|uniref:uncharacterized protein LOC123315030 n=1 Tax=Coccinella septempunctata TaxID=41139 RepID=UPI001D08161A|nr:uncharacterized protein LOC123315030 [Coccinella septempunctata]